MNSEEAEKLVWAAQTIFATGCEPRVLPCYQLGHIAMLVINWGEKRGCSSALQCVGLLWLM